MSKFGKKAMQKLCEHLSLYVNKTNPKNLASRCLFWNWDDIIG